MQLRGQLTDSNGRPIRVYVEDVETGEKVRVELRMRHGGLVLAVPVPDLDEHVEPSVSPTEAVEIPVERSQPIRLDDFVTPSAA